MNDARRQFFAQKSRTLNNIPPTQAALKQHIKCTCYQTNCWNQALVLGNKRSHSHITRAGQMKPFWTILPETWKSHHELIQCQYKKGCTGCCKCTKAGLECTALCFCSRVYNFAVIIFTVRCFRGKSRPGTLCGSRMKLCSLEGGAASQSSFQRVLSQDCFVTPGGAKSLR